MLHYLSRIEFLPIHKLLFCIYFHRARKVCIYFLPIEMTTVLQCVYGLIQYGIRGHKPDNCFGVMARHGIKNRLYGICRQKCLAAACGHLDAYLWNPWKRRFIIRDSAGSLEQADFHPFFFP